VKPALSFALGALLIVEMSGCGSPAAATATAPTTTSTPAGAPAGNLSGTWTGTGNDAQGPETFQWTVTQAGTAVTGTAILNSANPTDGTCGSCHKQKSGTLSGTMSGGALTLTLQFPAGGNDVTPLCGLTMNATTSDIAAGRIAATYTGTTTCEGAITDGTLVVTR
jgi:hypothetical protein